MKGLGGELGNEQPTAHNGVLLPSDAGNARFDNPPQLPAEDDAMNDVRQLEAVRLLARVIAAAENTSIPFEEIRNFLRGLACCPSWAVGPSVFGEHCTSHNIRKPRRHEPAVRLDCAAREALRAAKPREPECCKWCGLEKRLPNLIEHDSAWCCVASWSDTPCPDWDKAERKLRDAWWGVPLASRDTIPTSHSYLAELRERFISDQERTPKLYYEITML